MTYRLDRRDKKRTPCPACGSIGTWRPYINTETGEPLGECGRCDRENNCGHHFTPRQHFEATGSSYPIAKERTNMPQPKPKRTNWRTPPEWVEATMQSHGKNKFAHWLALTVGKNVAKDAFEKYGVGTMPKLAGWDSYEGACVWWQMGDDGRARSGKVMQYDAYGHRRKDLGSLWMHTIITRDQTTGVSKTADEIGCSQVLYGAHLLKSRPAAPVAIVESEKSALICACFYPSHVWLATGGMHGLSLEKTMCLSGRDVTLFPDQGALEKWSEKAMEFEPITSSLVVSDIMEAMGAESGEDLADYLIRPYDGGYYNEIAARGISIFSANVKAITLTEEPQQSIEPQVVAENVAENTSEYPPALRRMIESNPNVKILLEVLQPDLSAINFAPLNR